MDIGYGSSWGTDRVRHKEVAVPCEFIARREWRTIKLSRMQGEGCAFFPVDTGVYPLGRLYS